MNKIFMLSICLVSGTVFALSPEDRAATESHVRWGFAALPIAFGLVNQAVTLVVIFGFIRDCIRKGTYTNTSGFPLIGPIFIDVGLWWAPSEIPVWVFLLPWGIEFLAGIAAIVVRRKTHATLAPRRPSKPGSLPMPGK